MNPHRVRQAIYTLLFNPEQLTPGSAADLHLALFETNEFHQGQVHEILRQAVINLLNEVSPP